MQEITTCVRKLCETTSLIYVDLYLVSDWAPAGWAGGTHFHDSVATMRATICMFTWHELPCKISCIKGNPA